jgi:hypothetical protein
MRKIQALRIFLLFVALTSILMFPACKSSPFTVIYAGVEPLKLSRLSLVNIWDSVVKVAGFQETQAQFFSLSLLADKNSNIFSLNFNFIVTTPDRQEIAYHVDGGGSGIIRYYSSKTNTNINSSTPRETPREIFTEIDEVGLYSVKPGDGGISIRIDFMGGDVGYSHDYLDIFKISDGQLIPLKDIEFHTDQMWCVINFCNISAPGNITNVNGNTIIGTIKTTVTLGGNPSQGRNTQIWFLSEDVDRAETVEYLQN